MLRARIGEPAGLRRRKGLEKESAFTVHDQPNTSSVTLICVYATCGELTGPIENNIMGLSLSRAKFELLQVRPLIGADD